LAGQSRYERELRSKVRESERWPSFPTPAFLERLDVAANRAFGRRTVDGNLAAVLLYHQLVEEMLRLLLRDCEFFVQLAIFPAKITFPTAHKQMFGQLQQSVLNAMDFPEKRRLLARAAELNSLRINIVHGLTKRGSLNGLRRQASRAQRLYEICYRLFDAAHDDFRVCFKDFRKDKFEISGHRRIRITDPIRPLKMRTGG
jgi:hypothetical protein